MAVEKKKLQQEIESLGEAALRHGEELVSKATQLAEQGYEWAAPKAQSLYEDTVTYVAPKIEEAAVKVRPYLDNVHDKVVDDYLPRIEEAAREAQRAFSEDGSIAEKVTKATDVAVETLKTPKKRRFRAGRAALWTLGTAAVAGAGYLAWRRSQPIDDPWADEYWADLDTDVEADEFVVEEATVDAELAELEELEALEAELEKDEK